MRKNTTITVDEHFKKEALLIAKKKGINKFSTLINILLAEYVEKNKNIIKEQERLKESLK